MHNDDESCYNFMMYVDCHQQASYNQLKKRWELTAKWNGIIIEIYYCPFCGKKLEETADGGRAP